MSKVEFREADELVSALQNDVEGIIFELRGDDKKEERVGVPACFSGTPYDWLRLKHMEPVRKVEIEGDGLSFYGGYGNKLICRMPIRDLGDSFYEVYDEAIKCARGLRRFANLMEDSMEDYGN